MNVVALPDTLDGSLTINGGIILLSKPSAPSLAKERCGLRRAPVVA